MTTPSIESRPAWWWVHDILVGLLAGVGVGFVAGLFLNAQVENNVVVLICTILGAVLGVLVLIQDHRGATRFLSAVVIATWVLLVCSAAFIALFIFAVLNFE